ncbi:MAG TPA: hypothetical protein P5548_02105 [Candidatus Moranbacteria bacterium]|nr:hypothetical protein [Candidatus Moranbacteria bacterium]HRZ33666.1 hypothetical protein [Candidatus Moranbacteria bacterium]
MEKPNIDNHDEDEEIPFGFNPKNMYPDLVEMNEEKEGEDEAEKKAWENYERFPDQEEAAENKKEEVKSTEAEPENKDKNIETREQKIERLRKEVDEARKEYLEVDYKKNTALTRIRKFFISVRKDNEGRQFEKDTEVAFLRAHYDNKLFDLQKELSAGAKEKGATNEELEKIYIEFITEQRITMADETSNVRAEQMFKSKWGQIGDKLASVIKDYRSLPLKRKLQISAVFMGMTALTVGTGAAAIVGGAVVARRVFMGMVAGYGAKKGLEAWGKKKEKKQVEKEKQDFSEYLKNLEKMSDEEKRNELLKYSKYKIKENASKEEKEKQEEKINHAIQKENFRFAILEAKTEEIAIKDKENYINKIKNRDIKQTATGVAVGSVIAFGGQIYRFFSDHFGPEQAEQISHGSTDKLNYDKINKSSLMGGNPNVEETINDKGAISVKGIHEGLPDSAHVENLTIKEGSSIEKTLIEYMKTSHPEIKNPGAAAHRIWLDYMHDNKENIIKSVGADGYESMLKDGMVNVKAGTGLNVVFDKNGLSLHNIAGNISHIEHADFSPDDFKSPSLEDISAPEEPAVEDNITPEPEEFSDQATIDEMKESSADLQSDIDKLEKYEKYVSHHAGPQAAMERNFANAELHKLLMEKSILDLPDTRGSAIEIKNNIFGKSVKIFSELKNQNLAEIMKSEEAKAAFLEKIPKKGAMFFNKLIEQVPPKPGDTTIRWIARVVIEAKK